jgi:prepilin-type N-terminal cleavage/methylation domain-containing protein
MRQRSISRDGFTMMELLVTMVIAAIVFAAMVPVFVNAAKAAAGDQMRVTAQTIAQQKTEQIRLLQFDQLANLADSDVTAYTGTSGKAYHVHPYVEHYNPANASPTQAQNAEVVVDISWTDVYRAASGGAKKTMHVILKTIISRQFAGPGVQDVSLSPINQLGELNAAPTVITVRITPANAGANNGNVSSVKVTVADKTNASFTPVTLTATAVSTGVYTASWNQSGAAANDTFSFTAQATSTSQAPGNPFVKEAKLITGAAPVAVTNLAIARGNGRLLLTWDNSQATDFNHYEVWRGTSPGSEALLVDDLRASGYIDSSLTNGTTYYYKVRVVDNDGNSSPWASVIQSPTVSSDVTPPNAPTNFTASRSSNNAVLTLTVPSDTGSGIAGYFIYRDGEALPYVRWSPGGVAGTTVQYTDSIGYSIAHTYSVVAFDAVGLTSASTASQSVATAVPPSNLTLTVAVNQPSPVTVNVVYNDALPDPTDCGTKTASNALGGSPSWTSLAWGSYTVTATLGGTTIQQTISLTSSISITINF